MPIAIMNHPAKLYKEFHQKYYGLRIHLRFTTIGLIIFLTVVQ